MRSKAGAQIGGKIMDVTIIGCGEVGSVLGFALLGQADNLFLVDTDILRAQSVALDLKDAAVISRLSTDVYFSLRVVGHTDVYIICIGKRGPDRMASTNKTAFINVLMDIKPVSHNPFIIIVSNPTGELAKLALRNFSLVYAAGRDLDNARVKSISEHEKQEYGTEYHKVVQGAPSRFGISAEVILLLRRFSEDVQKFMITTEDSEEK